MNTRLKRKLTVWPGENLSKKTPQNGRSLAMLVTNSLTHSLTNCHLVNLIDVTLACEDGNSKFVEVVTVVDVDDEKQFIAGRG